MPLLGLLILLLGIPCRMSTWGDVVIPSGSGDGEAAGDWSAQPAAGVGASSAGSMEIESPNMGGASTPVALPPLQPEAPGVSILPDVFEQRASAESRRLRRGRTSALARELLDEHRATTTPAQPVARKSRAEVLALARQAKAAKRQKIHASDAVPVPCLDIVPAGKPAEFPSTSLDRPTLEQVGQGPVTVFGSSPLVSLLPRFLAMGSADAETTAIVDEFCRRETHSVLSGVARGHNIGVHRKTISAVMDQLGSAVVLADHAAFRSFEQVAATSSLKCLLYLEAAAYDETPLEVRTDEAVYNIIEQRRLAGGPDETAASDKIVVRVRESKVVSDTAPTKLFQTRMTTTILVKATPAPTAAAAAAAAADQYFLFSGNPVTWIQTLESASAECLKAALQAASPVSRASQAFGMRVRAATSDRLAANLKAERALAAERGLGWVSLQSACDVHSVAGAHTKALAFVSEFISLMVNLSLSLRLHGNMRRFRACLKQLIAAKLVIKQGESSREARDYREFCLKLFLARGSFAAKRRMLLWLWCNGEWRNPDAIEHYVDPRSAPEHREPAYISKMIAEAIVGSMATRAPKLFPRHRWTGSDIATDEIGLMLCVHNMLHDAYAAFLISFGHSGARALAPSRAGNPGSQQASQLLAIEDAVGDPGHEDAPGDHEAEHAREAEPDVEQPPFVEAVGGIGAADWQKMNMKFRQQGFLFIKQQPLATVMLLRLCIEPLRLLMSAHFLLAGKDWETTQRARDAAFLEGKPQAQPREYRAAIAAEGRLEVAFFDAILDLGTNHRPWRHIPSFRLTVAFRALAFKMLSRMGCVVEENLREPHSRFPVKLFLLLSDDSFAEEFVGAKACELDSFSRQFIQMFAEAGLSSPDALAVLRATALVWKFDISGIEARHAAIRRLLAASGHQTNVMSSKTLSSMWACSQLAARQTSCHGPGIKKLHLKDELRVGKRKKRARRRGRSAWQAYVSEASKGQHANFRQLHAAFQALPPEEVQRLRLKAQLASDAAAGNKVRRVWPFRNRLAKAIAAARQKQRRSQWSRRQALMDDGQRLDQTIADTLAAKASPEEAVAAAERAARFDAAMLRDAGRQAQAAIAAYRENEGLHAQRLFMEAAPAAAASHDRALVPYPCSHLYAFDFAPDSAALAEHTLSMAKATSRTGNLGMALKMDWTRRVATIKQDGLQQLPGLSKEERLANQCMHAGLCLCSTEGKTLKRFGNNFLTRVLKAACPPLTPNRALLMDGRVVVAFQSPAFDFAPLFVMKQAQPPDFITPAPGQSWFHIGLHYLKPYRPTFHELRRSSARPLVQGSVSLAGSWAFSSLFKAVAPLDRERPWWAQLFQIWESEEPIAEFVPGEFCARPLGQPILFWLPKRRAQSFARPQADQGDSANDGADCGAQGEEEEGSEPDDDDDAADGDDDFEASGGLQGEDGSEENLLAILSDMLEDIVEGHHNPIQQAQAPSQETPAAKSDPLPTEPAEAPEGAPAMQQPEVADGPPEVVTSLVSPEQLPAPPPLQQEVAPPPPPPAPAANQRGEYTAGRHPTRFMGGSITFYDQKDIPGKGRFQAVCGNTAMHGKLCRLTRTSAESARTGGAVAQGRPLGLLAAWLAAADFAETMEDHKAAIGFLSKHERSEARQKLMELTSGQSLAELERPRKPGEDAEPDALP